MEAQPQSTYVELQGDLSLERQAEIEAALPAVDPNVRVVLDCSRVSSADSSVIRIFMRFRRAYAEAGGDPQTNIIIIASPQMRRLLEIVGLSRWVTVVNAPVAPPAS